MAARETNSRTTHKSTGSAMTRAQKEELLEEMRKDPNVDRALMAARKEYPQLGRKASTTRDVSRRSKG